MKRTPETPPGAVEAQPVVVCGHVALDIIPGFLPMAGPHDYFRPGRLTMLGAPTISTGGAMCNTGLSLHRLGVPVRLIGKIGEDAVGRLIVEHIETEGEGLARWIRSVKNEVSSYTVVLNPPGIDRIFLHCPGANDTFTDDDVPEDVLKGAEIFHFGYPPLMERIFSDGGSRLSRIFERARRQGALNSLDMSLPDPSSPSGKVDWGGFLSRVLPLVDCFVPSVEEFLFMIDRPAFDRFSARGAAAISSEIRFAELEALSRWAMRRGPKVVLVKLGERGAYLRTGALAIKGLAGWAERELYSPVFTVTEVAGTTGAGDATIAGLLASMSKGLAAEEALTMAVAIGGCCVEAPDATSGIRSWDETRERVRAGWPRQEAVVSEPGWKALPSRVWAGPNDRPSRR
jgi:sugar/nucleoside kinase (ribokinase family)